MHIILFINICWSEFCYSNLVLFDTIIADSFITFLQGRLYHIGEIDNRLGRQSRDEIFIFITRNRWEKHKISISYFKFTVNWLHFSKCAMNSFYVTILWERLKNCVDLTGKFWFLLISSWKYNFRLLNDRLIYLMIEGAQIFILLRAPNFLKSGLNFSVIFIMKNCQLYNHC